MPTCSLVENANPLAPLTAVVLAGGQGTRLRSVLADVPKVIAPVRGRPFLVWLLDRLAAAGLRRAVISTGYRAEQVEAAVGRNCGPLELVYSPESSPLGTAGALRAALPHLTGQRTLVMNGDSYWRADLGALVQFHQTHAAAATLLLAHLPDTGRYGRVLLADDGRVTQFAEKQDSAGPGWINAGVYVIETARVVEIPTGRAVSLERETFPGWIGRGLCGYAGADRFLDIGTPESYAQADAYFAEEESQ
jgi:D-glycero-alpha-D-manno-heptose 1-phosphate guanylyltransferase